MSTGNARYCMQHGEGRCKPTLEAVLLLLAPEDGVQHVRNVAHAARRKLLVVGLVSLGGTGIHDEVSKGATRNTLGRVVVLR